MGIERITEIMESAVVPAVTSAVTFHSAITQAAAGTILTVGGYKTLKVSVYGTATARTVQFFALNTNGTPDAIPINGYNISTLAVATSTSGATSETWMFDITGIYQIEMNVSVVSGGNLTVVGTAVS